MTPIGSQNYWTEGTVRPMRPFIFGEFLERNRYAHGVSLVVSQLENLTAKVCGSHHFRAEQAIPLPEPRLEEVKQRQLPDPSRVRDPEFRGHGLRDDLPRPPRLLPQPLLEVAGAAVGE